MLEESIFKARLNRRNGSNFIEISSQKLSVAPISLNSAAIRRRTRAALESLSNDAEGLAKVGLEPEDGS